MLAAVRLAESAVTFRTTGSVDALSGDGVLASAACADDSLSDVSDSSDVFGCISPFMLSTEFFGASITVDAALAAIVAGACDSSGRAAVAAVSCTASGAASAAVA